MSGTDLSSISGALKRVYGKYVTRMQNLKHRAVDEIAQTARKYNAGGEGFFGAINDYGNEAGGAINETEAFRSIDNENYAQFKVQPKVIVWPIAFSGLSAKAAESDDESFVGAVVDALDRARERMLKDENRQFYGVGTGQLCLPAQTVASNLTSFTVDSAQYLRRNMVLDIFDGATKTVDSIRVSDVDKINSIVYLATSLGAAMKVTSVLVKENVRDSAASDGKEMMGLAGIADDGTDLTTFQNIDASANRIWRGRRIDANSANLSSDLLQRLCDDISVLSGEDVDLLIMHKKQRRKYLDIVLPQKRYADGNMDAGFKKLEFNGMELWLDDDCQDNRVYGGVKKLLEKFEVGPMEMGSHDGSDKFLRAIGYDKFEAYWRHYCNFGTSKRNAFGSIVSLAKPTGVA